MTVADLKQRAEAVCKKYEKYDAPQKAERSKSQDPFMEMYSEVESEVNILMEAASDVQLEFNRSIIAQKNAEIRRAKNVLLTDAVQELEKLIKKGKGVDRAVIAQRQEKISALVDMIYGIPDGTSAGIRRPKRAGQGKGTKKDPIILDATGASSSHAPGYWGTNEEVQAFEKGWQDEKTKQDAQLDRIGKVVDSIKGVAVAMDEELRRQAPITEDIENQVDKVSHGLKTNNAKLQGLVKSVRSSRNFCVDVILICVVLAIGAYIYSMFKK